MFAGIPHSLRTDSMPLLLVPSRDKDTTHTYLTYLELNSFLTVRPVKHSHHLYQQSVPSETVVRDIAAGEQEMGIKLKVNTTEKVGGVGGSFTSWRFSQARVLFPWRCGTVWTSCSWVRLRLHLPRPETKGTPSVLASRLYTTSQSCELHHY